MPDADSRQIDGEVEADIPAEFMAAWADAVNSRSNTKKGQLFKLFLKSGGDWSRLLLLCTVFTKGLRRLSGENSCVLLLCEALLFGVQQAHRSGNWP